MSNWYLVQRGNASAFVRATNTRTAVDEGFVELCGRGYKMATHERMTLSLAKFSNNDSDAQHQEELYRIKRSKRGER